MMMMNSSGRKTSHGASYNGRHKKVTKQPSDPGYLAKNSSNSIKRKEVRDIYTSVVGQDNSTKEKVNDGDQGFSGVKPLSQSGVTPGSHEFQTVLKHFIPEPEPEKQQVKDCKPLKTKCRKISFNDFGRASRFAKRLEEISFTSPRPKRSIDMTTSPASSLTSLNPDHHKLQNNATITQSRKSFPFYGIKEAWYDPERSLQGDSRAERRRHVSLPAPPTGFSLQKLTTDSLETLVEPFTKTDSKPTRRKSNSNNNSGSRTRRKISTIVSPNLNGMSSEANNLPPHNPPRKYSPARSVDSETAESKMKSRKTTPPHFDVKKKTSGSMGQDLHPNLLLGVKQSCSHEEELSPRIEKQFSAEDTAGEQHVAMKAHKNFKRIGKAALAARRFLRINNADETQTHTISPLAKEEEKQFEEMVAEMKTSYQDMCLDEQEKQASDEEY